MSFGEIANFFIILIFISTAEFITYYLLLSENLSQFSNLQNSAFTFARSLLNGNYIFAKIQEAKPFFGLLQVLF